MTIPLRIGFIPLLDAALLVAARDEGFAEAEGLRLDLVREVSWANIRDKLNVGLFDAAHMLAPAAIASTLGLGHIKVAISVPIALNLNGNAITVSRPLYEALAAEAATAPSQDPRASSAALKRLIGRRAAAGQPPLTFAHTFPFSTHHYQLRTWMAAGGIDPERDTNLVVIPPPLMAKSLESGHVDGFCVGAPWNATTIAAGHAMIMHHGTQIVADCPEKVLGVPTRLVDERPETVTALVRALAGAAGWCADPANRAALARLMARPEILGVAPAIVEMILAGALSLGPAAPAAPDLAYIRLDPAALRPIAAQVDFLLAQMADAGQLASPGAHRADAHRVYRPDLFECAGVTAGQTPIPQPFAARLRDGR
ncbi:CmpA/NrtA family ABC transporter substrate-binding protein [Chelatococcus reniformis]|uniref:Nitrate transporter n=1 Tax=Chelatococcus reniformis TaxID=1494448 RepID=A0A916UAM5_9HYPH|nr:CmpA/NrtA family ABC transporter substrate-binding protein [Chelatococcus reniformis]GGC65935.1 nitrate transporter [Chelatococcus reniformis]